MSKSQYPNKIDTSIEIPAVRDNIVEIGSDVINSLRSAIFNIERTLGINPQGAAGNTVSSRLSKSLDSNGNILKEAMDRSGVLSGPLSDKDISKTAAISERKLNLDYPTNLLQEEISQIHYQMNIIDETLNGLSALFATHVHPSAKNRHPASAISVDEISNTTSSEAISSYETGDVQDILGKLFSSHINYDGSNISKDNRSHKSDQIFFDNAETSAYISSDDAQGAIEDVLFSTIGQLDEHQASFHSNSIERSSSLYSPSDSENSKILISEEEISFASLSHTKEEDISLVYFITPVPYSGFEILKSDVAIITNGDSQSRYQISDINISSDGTSIESLSLYGRILEDSVSGATISVYRSKIQESNFSELLIGVREYQSLSSSSYYNADIIQISNPNATSIVSRGIRPKEISLTNRFVKISIDSASDITLDLYDSSTTEGQSLDTIIKTLNEQFSENRLSVMAYRVDFDNYQSSEIAICHRLQNSATREHTIELKRGSDDALDSFGFGYAEDVVYTSEVGRKNYISGASGLELFEIFNQKGLTLVSGTSEIGSYDVNPLEYGVRNGHVITISGTPSDDGTYTITNVTNDSIVVDKNQLPDGFWSSTTTEDSEFIITSDSISLNGMAFEATVSPYSASSIVEIFLDKNRKLYFNRRLSYERVSYAGSESLISPVDFDGKLEVYSADSPGALLVTRPISDPSVKTVEVSLDGGASEIVTSVKNKYLTLKSGKHNLSLTIFIKDSDTLNSKILSDGAATSVSLYGSPSVSYGENLLIGAVHYEAAISRVTGFGKDYPRSFSKIRRGGIGLKDIGSDTRAALEVTPHREKRSNGVINGLEILSVTDNGSTYVVSISSGICYVKGKRFEISETLDYITDIETGTGPVVDKFYIAIDEWGHLIFSPADSVTCGCTLDPDDFCIIGSAENSSSITTYDLRLFIDNLDFKLLNAINVSPQPGMGHFSDFGKAVAYAKRFGEIFPKAGTPTIHLKSGRHVIDVKFPWLSDGTGRPSSVQDQIKAFASAQLRAGTWLNFPVNITGEGDSTVLDIYHTFEDQNYDLSTDKITIPSAQGYLYIVGSGSSSYLPESDLNVFDEGVISLSSFKMNMSRIFGVDPRVEDDDSNKLNFDIIIKDITFDFSLSEEIFDHTYGISIAKQESSTSDVIGNISVLNCSFLNSYIDIGSREDGDLRNINIISNTFRGKGNVAGDGESNWAVRCGTDPTDYKSILDPLLYPSYCNINVHGNIIADNGADSADPKFDTDGETVWGDRINRDLYVGGRVHIPAIKDVKPDDNETGALIIGNKTASHLAIDDNEIMARAGNAMSTLFLNNEGGGKVRVGTGLGDAEYDTEVLEAYGRTVVTTISVGTEGGGEPQNHGLLNVGYKSNAPGLYLEANNGAGVGDIVTYGDSTVTRDISIGWYDFSETNESPMDTYFHEQFRLEHQKSGGRFHIFSNENDISTKAGISFHKAGDHNGERPTEPDDKVQWRLHYRHNTAQGYNDVFAFYFHDDTETIASSSVKGYIDPNSPAGEIDFTGQHRSFSNNGELYNSSKIGLIVRATGEYIDLSHEAKISINEALPTVSLANSANDKAVFGVISGHEDFNNESRTYSSGSFVSVMKKKDGDNRLIVNSLGEGGIWITNINGSFENGDYITSSNIPGYGMKQDDDLLHNYTVAKITCDCNFDLNSTIYKCEEFTHNGTTYKRAFVGCTYHCG